MSDEEQRQDTVLDEAKKIIYGQRQDDYGSLKDSFERIASLWSAYLNYPVNVNDVTNMMILLKVSRSAEHTETFQRDSYVDIAGYAACLERIHSDV